MKQKPILFNTEMVKAILEGRKIQTRRIIKHKNLGEHDYYCPNGEITYFNESWGCPLCGQFHWDNSLKSPYSIGDQLWVRETFATSADGFIWYKATEQKKLKLKWKPSIFMPKIAARIFLEITNIRVERIQDISEDDSGSEGIILNKDYFENAGSENLFNCPNCNGYQVHGAVGENLGMTEIDCITCDTQKKRFKILWNSINEKRGYGWDKNSWVWVYEFKKIEK